MRFLLSKPLHGWREFAGEVGIIVIGVLIALGAEQMVESYHWRAEVAAERQALDAEAKELMEGPVFRQGIQRCIDNRLDEIGRLIDRHQHRKPLAIVGRIARPARVTASTGTWEIALSGQALAHMNHAEKLNYSGAFDTLKGWMGNSAEESDTWLGLLPFNKAAALSNGGWDNVIAAYEHAVAVNELNRLLAPYTIRKVSTALKIHAPRAAETAGFERYVAQICNPIIS